MLKILFVKCSLTISVVLAVITSCNLKTSPVNAPFKAIVVDTFSFEWIQKAAKSLNYSSLTNGVDSLELRLWTGLGHTDYTSVRVIKNDEANWYLSETRYWLGEGGNYSDQKSKTVLDSGYIKPAVLLVSYKEFVHSLSLFRLDTFPSQSQIPGFQDNVAGGNYYDLEIATKTYYKHLSYHQPEHYRDKYNSKFCRILELLNAQRFLF